MDSQNLPINIEKIEKLYDEIQAIENNNELTPEQKKEKRLALLDVIDLR
jgi:UDP-galactopyranose mutase